MPLAAGLRNIPRPEVVVQATDHDGIELREKKREVDMRVKVVGLPAGFIAIRIEKVGHTSKISDGSWKQICDYLLVVESGDRTHAVFVELKKTKTEEEKPREQLRRSLPLLEYLRSVWEIESRTVFNEHGVSHTLFDSVRADQSETGQTVSESCSDTKCKRGGVQGHHDQDICGNVGSFFILDGLNNLVRDPAPTSPITHSAARPACARHRAAARPGRRRATRRTRNPRRNGPRAGVAPVCRLTQCWSRPLTSMPQVFPPRVTTTSTST